MIKQLTITLLTIMSLGLTACGNEKKYPASKKTDQTPKSQANPSATKVPTSDAEPSGIAQELVYTTYRLNQIQCFQSNNEIQAKPKLPAFAQYFELQAIETLWRKNSKQEAIQQIENSIDSDTDRYGKINALRDSRSTDLKLKKEQYRNLGTEIIQNSKDLLNQRMSGQLTDIEYKQKVDENILTTILEREKIKNEINALQDLIYQEDENLLDELSALNSRETYYTNLAKGISSTETVTKLSSIQLSLESLWLNWEFQYGIGDASCEITRSFLSSGLLLSKDQKVTSKTKIEAKNHARYFGYSWVTEANPSTNCNHFLPLPRRTGSKGESIEDPGRVSDICGDQANEVVLSLVK